MKVQVKNESGKILSFEAPEDIQLGELVSAWVDTFWNGGSRFTGNVISLESDYTGRCVTVKRVDK